LRGGFFGESSTLKYLEVLEKQGAKLYRKLVEKERSPVKDFDAYDKMIYGLFQQVCDKIKEVCRTLKSKSIDTKETCKIDLTVGAVDGDRNQVNQGTKLDVSLQPDGTIKENYYGACLAPGIFYDNLRIISPTEAKVFKEWVKNLNLEKKLRDRDTGKLMF
jgi:hypothetical protein